jgi:hypothetical protein
MKVKEAGPWRVMVSNRVSGGVMVASEDFTHDVILIVQGNFGALSERVAYAEEIARRLNSWKEPDAP